MTNQQKWLILANRPNRRPQDKLVADNRALAVARSHQPKLGSKARSKSMGSSNTFRAENFTHRKMW